MLLGSIPRFFRTCKQRLRRESSIVFMSFGSLRRLEPVSRIFGLDRGKPVDRCFIERFLDRCAEDVHGHVLEIGDNTYTVRYGGARVTQSDVLHATPDNPKANIIADLTSAYQIPSETFDCIILTQTLQYIFDPRAAIRTLYRILKSGGIVLATFPGISQISRYDMGRWGDYWRFTTLSARRLFEEVFPAENLEIHAYGNVFVAIAFLHGLATEELTKKELDHVDPDYEVVITVRAVKPLNRSSQP